MKQKKRILVGSPIHQKPQILEQFILSLISLKKETFDVNFLFIDDNSNVESSIILERYNKSSINIEIKKSSESDIYYTDGSTHLWTEKLVWKVAKFKNYIIEKALKEDYDYLFFIDSDIILHPETIEHLIRQDKDIISEIFWTKWQPDSIELPQVWISDQYTMYKKHRSETLNEEEINNRIYKFINQLKVPGVYEVGGLGACTLISKNALQKGVNFSEIANVSFWGEDRHFCIRALAIGLKLYVDTNYPAYHIYREEDLSGAITYNLVNKYKNEIFEIVKNGLECIGTYDFRVGYFKEWNPFFTEAFAVNLKEYINKNTGEYLSKKLIVKAMVSKFIILEINDKSALIKCNILNQGFENDIEFRETSECQVELVFEKDSIRINNFFVTGETRDDNKR